MTDAAAAATALLILQATTTRLTRVDLQAVVVLVGIFKEAIHWVEDFV